MVSHITYKIMFMILIFMLTYAQATVGWACGMELPEYEEIVIDVKAI